MSNQTQLRLQKKTLENDFLSYANPFSENISDSAIVSVSSSIRNTIYFNRSSSKFGLDINWLDTRDKTLLNNGFDSRILKEKGGSARYNFTRAVGIQASYKAGEKIDSSQFFSTRNFHIYYTDMEPRISYQPGVSFRTTFIYKLTQKQNKTVFNETNEKANNQKFGVEFKYNTVTTGNILLRFNYHLIKYNAAENTLLAFEMLEGLKPGKNFSWGASVQRNLSNNMQLSLTYDGHQSEASRMIHVGNVQLRAYF